MTQGQKEQLRATLLVLCLLVTAPLWIWLWLLGLVAIKLVGGIVLIIIVVAGIVSLFQRRET